MVIIDLIVTLFQGVFLGIALNKCLKENSKVKFLIIVLLDVLLTSDLVINILGDYKWFVSIIFTLLFMIIISFFYKNKIKQSLTVCSICTIILGAFMIIGSNVIFAVIDTIVNIENPDYILIYVVYIPQILLTIFLIKNINMIKYFYKFIIYESMEIGTMAICCISCFTAMFYRMTFNHWSQLVENSLQITFSICLVGLIVYFSKIYSKSKKIIMLNTALETKNKELRKIKHDYGAQISYLYGLALMGRHDDLKKSLKNIINVSQSTTGAVQVTIPEEKCYDSILSVAVKPAIDKGIHVILEEEYNINSLNINEIELYRIITNIINNAIKAMDGKGIIVVKTYKLVNNVLIDIINNGPKIPEENIEAIFEAGFTTKNNDDKSHGFGLNIVKELVEKNNGTISVKSTESKTVFKICFIID